MSDIAPIHGLGALIIFLVLLLLNSIFLMLSILFLLVEKRKKRRLIKALNAKGLFISTLIVEIILIGLILFVEFSNNYQALDFLDIVSPIIALITVISLVIVNIKYSRVYRNLH